MQIACAVVEDLLPLYHDGVCSAESRGLVEEHMSTCAHCREILAGMQEEISDPAQYLQEAKPLLRLGRLWAEGKRRAFWKGAGLVLLACGLLLGGYVGLTQWKCLPVPSERMEISEVSLAEDGKIFYHFRILDEKNLRVIAFDYKKDGRFYMTPLRSVIEYKRVTAEGLYNHSDVLDLAWVQENANERGIKAEITEVYFGTEEDSILLWEKTSGME